MKTTETRASRSRLRSSYFTSVISIMLLLLMLGLLGFVILNTKKISDYVRQNIGFSIMFSETARESDILRLQKYIDAQPYTKSTRFIPPEEALKELEKELGEDFMSFLGYNPLQPIIEVKIHPDWAVADSLEKIVRYMGTQPGVEQTYYEQSLLEKVNQNVKKISIFMLSFTGLLFLISLALINNTIRLAVYSKRFLIRTMQLVGATDSFIRRPFVLRSMLHGLYAGLAASALLTIIIYYGTRDFKDIYELFDLRIMAFLYPVLIGIGVGMNAISSFFSVNRYLRMNKDELYF
ncbi:MAG: cell division protein FtsX [Bacteroidales bacterium]